MAGIHKSADERATRRAALVPAQREARKILARMTAEAAGQAAFKARLPSLPSPRRKAKQARRRRTLLRLRRVTLRSATVFMRKDEERAA